MSPTSAYVMDAFAIMAYLKDESGAGFVAGLFAKARQGHVKLLMHCINVGEVYYSLARDKGELAADRAYSVMKAYPITYVYEISERLLIAAARLKASYPIAFADAFAVATAQLNDARLVSGDPDLRPLVADHLVDVAWSRT